MRRDRLTAARAKKRIERRVGPLSLVRPARWRLRCRYEVGGIGRRSVRGDNRARVYVGPEGVSQTPAAAGPTTHPYALRGTPGRRRITTTCRTRQTPRLATGVPKVINFVVSSSLYRTAAVAATAVYTYIYIYISLPFASFTLRC